MLHVFLLQVEEVSTEVGRLDRCLSQALCPPTGSNQTDRHVEEQDKVRMVADMSVILQFICLAFFYAFCLMADLFKNYSWRPYNCRLLRVYGAGHRH